MMLPELPEDLLEEILCRVRATSLQRLRSTCKRWNLLFNDRRFTKKQHFHKSPRHSQILMLNSSGFYSMSINLHRVSPVEIINLVKPHSSFDFDQFTITQVSQSDGLVLCVCHSNMRANTRLMILNPCTGQTKWIQHIKRCKWGYAYTYALGSYQDRKSGNNSYKILMSYKIFGDPKLEIYEINSNSWRILDVPMDCNILHCQRNVSLKGKSYWFAEDELEKQPDLCLISFDYKTESFERLRLRLPYQYHDYQSNSLSLVREEKLSLLLQPKFTSKTEVWVTNKIGETKVLSWIKVLSVELKPRLQFGPKFVVDEEMKVLMCTRYTHAGQYMLYIVGEDNRVREEAFRNELYPYLFYYVPSLIEIEQGDHD